MPYRLSDSPNCADVDSLDALEGQDASKQSRNNDEDTRAKQDTNGNLASNRQLDLPQ